MSSKKNPLKADVDDSALKMEILQAYVSIVTDSNMFPTRSDLANVGITRDKIRHHFVNLSGLRKAAKEALPEAFAGIIKEEDFTSKRARAELAKDLKTKKTFIITTAINGQWAHSKFLEGLDTLAKNYDAKILLLPCHDPAHNLDNEIEWHFDNLLKDYTFVFDDITLNSNLHIGQMGVNAKQINPTTGLSRICQGMGSFIFASPKQSLEYDPVSNVKYPHARMTTGACTLGNYSSARGNSIRSSKIASHDHVVGALIVEIENDQLYHFRQIQADEEGGFCELGKYYLGRAKPKKVIPKLVMGDYHAGEHDETAIKAWEEIIDKLQVDEVFFHDLFNGKSINHHEEHNIVLRARHAAQGLLSLESELAVTGKQVDRILSHKSVKKGIVVKSNHDDFLDRWLNEGKFKYDPLNFKAGCLLAGLAVDGTDPLEQGLKNYGRIKNTKKLLLLNRDQDYKIAGIELGAHGDKGPNGSRGSKASLERAYGSCVIGHSHTPGILRGVFQVGTSSLFDLGYNKGPSSWMHCSCLVYPNGNRQLINSIEGKWRLER
jgi:LmbE family N-acetylglucosaminyl deacetylase